jgi:hypothetical protein
MRPSSPRYSSESIAGIVDSDIHGRRTPTMPAYHPFHGLPIRRRIKKNRPSQTFVRTDCRDRVVVVCAENAGSGNDSKADAVRVKLCQILLGGELVVRTVPRIGDQGHAFRPDVRMRIDHRNWRRFSHRCVPRFFPYRDARASPASNK